MRVKYFGLLPEVVKNIFTRVVPVAVPLVFQSSVPFKPSLATKKQRAIDIDKFLEDHWSQPLYKYLLPLLYLLQSHRFFHNSPLFVGAGLPGFPGGIGSLTVVKYK
jgi:hypothetical protein